MKPTNVVEKDKQKIPIILRETQVFQECILAEQFFFGSDSTLPVTGKYLPTWMVDFYPESIGTLYQVLWILYGVDGRNPANTS